jgi:putative heme transporter
MRIQNAFRVGLFGAFGVGIALMLMSAMTSLATILTYIGAALFLSLGLDPAVNWLEKKKLPRWAAIVLVLAVVLLGVTILVLSIIPLVTEQASGFIVGLPALIESMKTEDWAGYLNTQFNGIIDVDALINQVANFFKDPTHILEIAGGALAVGVSIANGVFGAFVVLILTLYFTASLKHIKNATYRLVPASNRDRFIELSTQITDGVGRYVVGQILLGLLNGILTFILLTVIGGRAAIVFAFIAFGMSLIPLVGTLTGSIIIVLAQLVLADSTVALIAAIYYIIYMQVEAYVVSPKIMNRAVQIPGSIVVIAALAGGSLLGILGALIAIPVAASIVLIVKQVIMPMQEKR